ncbi:MAG: hypothetical protein Q8P99_01435 [bacterium]|nr:hypothetical protein [bacterium]
MSIKTRRLLFYSSIILFLLLGSFLVLNSRGYHLDWRTLQFEATGGIYLSSTPAKVTITLEEKSIKNQTGLFQRGTLIDNLAPDTYPVQVQLEGYSLWQKEIPVKSGAVSVFDAIVLVPDEEALPTASMAARAMVAAGRHLALETGGGVSLNGTTVLGHEIITLTESGSLLTRSTATGNYYLANAFETDQNLNLTLTFNNLKRDILNLPGAIDIKKILPYPYSDRRFVVSTERAIYLLDTERLTIEQIALGTSDFYIQGSNGVAWVEESNIRLFNLPLRTKNLAVDLGVIDPDEVGKIQNTSKGWLILDGSGRLLLFSGNREPEVLAKAVVDFSLAPNGEYVAMESVSGPMLIYGFTEESTAQVELPSSIQEFAWFKDSAHLLVLSGGKLIFTEVSEALSLNQVTLGIEVYAFSYAPGSNSVQFSTPQGIFLKKIII